MTRNAAWLQRIAFVLPLITILLSAFVLYIVNDSANVADSLANGFEATACRAQYSAEIVAPAQDRMSNVANQSVTLVMASQAIILNGLIATVHNDDAALAPIEAQGAATAQAIAAASTSYAQATEDLATARASYAKLIQKSIDDPAAFLEACRASHP